MPRRLLRDPDQLQALLDAVLSIESDLELPGVLQRVTETARSLTGARYGALGVLDPSGNGLSEFVHAGIGDATARAIGPPPKGAGILGLVTFDPRPLRLDDLSIHPASVGFPAGHPPMRTFLGVPLWVGDKVFGNLYLTEKEGAGGFSEEDEALVVALAAAAGIVVDHARLQARVGELTLAADRERIARDLHDTVIQRLFAAGLSLQSTLPLAHDPELRARLEESVSELDDVIRQVRTTIFALEPQPSAEPGVRARVLDVCAQAAHSLGFEPEVRFAGTIEDQVSAPVTAELLPSLREMLSNVSRHAQARRVEVDLSVSEDICLRVVDDGVGLEAGRHRAGRGLPNMAGRAEALGGSFTLTGAPDGGTEVVWRVPLGRP